MGRWMEAQLRFSVRDRYPFAWPGGDPFGNDTFNRPWMHGAVNRDV